MRKGDIQFGQPLTHYTDTKTNIEALDVPDGSEAYGYTTDPEVDGEWGQKINGVWVWGSSGGYTPPTTTAANDFQVGDGSGNWIKKTLAQTVTILRTSLDSIYAAISHTHAHADLTSVSANQHHNEDHDHAGSPTQKLAQANTHESADTDASTSSLHHTIGTGANQASAGNHNHTGTYQPLDSDLTAIAGLSPADDDILQRKSGSWVSRTLAQLITDLTERIQDLVGGMIGDISAGVIATYNDATGLIDYQIDGAFLVDYIESYGIPTDGWSAPGDTWSYASADDPVYQIYVSGNVTARPEYKAGNKVKCTNNSTTFYGFIVKVGSYDSGNNRTPVDLYGGTDYDLANSAITDVFIGKVKSPDGFPLNPDKWTVKTTDTADRTQSTPTTNTWYNPGSLSISIPIGAWEVSYKVLARAARAASTATNMASTLSTANNSESDTDMTTFLTLNGASGSLVLLATQHCLPKIFALTSKTSYFLNCRTTTGADSIGHRGDVGTTVIKAVCAYL